MSPLPFSPLRPPSPAKENFGFTWTQRSQVLRGRIERGTVHRISTKSPRGQWPGWARGWKNARTAECSANRWGACAHASALCAFSSPPPCDADANAAVAAEEVGGRGANRPAHGRTGRSAGSGHARIRPRHPHVGARRCAVLPRPYHTETGMAPACHRPREDLSGPWDSEPRITGTQETVAMPVAPPAEGTDGCFLKMIVKKQNRY